MRVLVVDDDLSTVECIVSSIDWEALGVTDVYTAHSKNGALSLMAENTVDIVLCDIEMPNGSGLELLQEVRSQENYCDFIFLTCHDRFSFASTALEFKASSYVLKPFDPERVTAELVKVIEHQKSLRSIYESSHYGEYFLKNKVGIEKGFWRDLVSNKLSNVRSEILAEASQRGVEPRQEETLTLALFSFQYDTLSDIAGPTKEKWAVEIVNFLLSDDTAALNEARIVSNWRGERLHVFCIEPPNSCAFTEKLRRLLAKCKKELPVVVNGYAAEGLYVEQFAHAARALEKLDCNNVSNLANMQLYTEKQSGETSKVCMDLSRFKSILAGGNKVRILTYLKGQLETLAPERALTPAVLYAAQQEIIQEVYLYLLVKGIKFELPASDDESYAVMQNASTSMYNMLKWLSFFINLAVDADSSLSSKKSVVDQAKTYIEAHYTEAITQNEIAKVVYLTPGHLSRLFKKETGVSINQYVNDRRLAQAKELLISTDVSINEVALRSGFGSSSYFITSFRKLTGETPQKFRENRTETGKMDTQEK